MYHRSPIMKHGMNIMPHEWQKLKDAEAILRQGLIGLKKGHYESFQMNCFDFEDAMQYYYANYADRPAPKKLYVIDEWLAALNEEGICYTIEGGKKYEGFLIFNLYNTFV